MNGERRRYPRLRVQLPLEFRLCRPQDGAGPGGRGTLKDISLGGLYFLCPPPAPIRVGHTLDLTIATTPTDLENPRASCLQARCRVVRLDPPAKGSFHMGIAVSFLAGLSLSPR
jgi:hypothetical protein